MSACTDLINAINEVVVNPNTIATIAPSSVSSLTNIGSTLSVFQLSAGGNAILSLPSANDSVPFRLTASGMFSLTGSAYLYCSLFLGTNTSGTVMQTVTSNVSTAGCFWMEVDGIWTSAASKLSGFQSSIVTDNGGSDNSVLPAESGFTSSSAPSFVIAAKFNGTTSASSATLTEFTLSYL